MSNNQIPTPCIGPTSISILPFSPSDAFHSCHKYRAQQHALVDKPRRSLSPNRKAICVQVPSERHPQTKAQVFQGLHTFLMPLIMSKAMKEAQLKVRINKPACYHAFRYPLATHLLENGYDISTIEELRGNKVCQHHDDLHLSQQVAS